MNATASAALLSVDVREKCIGTRVVLSHVRLTAVAGEVTAVLGKSGCGKSTLLRLINGLDRHYSGTIGLPEMTGNIGMVFQEPRLLPWLTVGDNVRFALEVPDARERADRVLDEVGLSGAAKLFPKQLSGGMAQRVAIARALVREPSVLLMDEPFSALDVVTRKVLHALTLEVTRRHRTATLFVTHDPDEALDLSQRVVVLAPARGGGAASVSLSVAPSCNPLVRDRQRQEILGALEHERG